MGIEKMAIDYNDETLFTAGDDGAIIVYDIQDKECKFILSK